MTFTKFWEKIKIAAGFKLKLSTALPRQKSIKKGRRSFSDELIMTFLICEQLMKEKGSEKCHWYDFHLPEN